MDVLGQVLLEQGSADLLYKGPDREYTVFGLAGCMVSVAATQLSLCCLKADIRRQHIPNRLVSMPLKFYLTGTQLDLALGPEFPDCCSSDWAKKYASSIYISS